MKTFFTLLCFALLITLAFAEFDEKHAGKKAAAKEHHASLLRKATNDEPIGWYGYGQGPIEIDPAPEGWICFDEYYGTLDGCDCNCGIADPDCSVEGQTVYGCQPDDNERSVCNAQSECEYVEIEIPAEWHCSDSYYASNDGCDCNCGVFDPDCEISEQFIFGCNDGIGPLCLEPGYCVYDSPIPEGWVCSAGYYGTADGCDCNCGRHDPDCDLPTEEGGNLLRCPCSDETMSCSNSGFCTGVCGDFYISAVSIDGSDNGEYECAPTIVKVDDDDNTGIIVGNDCDCSNSNNSNSDSSSNSNNGGDDDDDNNNGGDDDDNDNDDNGDDDDDDNSASTITVALLASFLVLLALF